MKIRHATQSDLQGIAANHAERWKDSYSDVLPADFLAAQIDRDLAKHWSEIEIQNEDIVLVAEEDAIVGYEDLSRKIEWDDLSVICKNL